MSINSKKLYNVLSEPELSILKSAQAVVPAQGDVQQQQQQQPLQQQQQQPLQQQQQQVQPMGGVLQPMEALAEIFNQQVEITNLLGQWLDMYGSGPSPSIMNAQQTPAQQMSPAAPAQQAPPIQTKSQ